jgi:hypothetical protein
METREMTPYQVAVAAEGFAAALFARAGFHVSVQYGANQPGYDLIVERNRVAYLISVKGSQDGGWGLTQSYLKNANYHAAIDIWSKRHSAELIFCFVQFQHKQHTEMPEVFLARATEVAAHLRASGGGLGDTVLWMKKEWKKGRRAGIADTIPEAWRFTKARADQVLK